MFFSKIQHAGFMSISNYHPTHIVFGKILNGIAPSRRKIISTKRCCNERFRDVFFLSRMPWFLYIYIYIHSYSLNRGRFRLQIWMDNSEKKQTKIWRNPKIASPLASRNVVRETISLQVSRICGKGTKGEIEPTKTVLFPFSLTVKMTSITGRLTCHCLGVL